MAFTISRRFSRALCASRTRVFDALRGRYTCVLLSFSGDALCRPGPPEPGRRLKPLQLPNSIDVEITAPVGVIAAGPEDLEPAARRISAPPGWLKLASTASKTMELRTNPRVELTFTDSPTGARPRSPPRAHLVG